MKPNTTTPVCFLINPGVFLLALLALTEIPLAAHATPEMNQRETQLHNRKLNDRGADESLKNSSVYAMQALMDLAATKLPSAVSNGYRAYGKFRNSENLDRLKDQNALNANSLTSVDSGTAALPTNTNTSFRRIDPGFLRDGEAAKVAAEFERQTGMKREDFLTHMADVSEKKIKRTDPMMIDKALSRFEGFIDKIPNQEFRKNLEKNIALVPSSLRRGMIATAVGKLAGFFASNGHPSAPELMGTSMADAGKVGATAGIGGAASAGGALAAAGDPLGLAAGLEGGAADSDRHPASSGATLATDLAPLANAKIDNAGKNELTTVVAAALATGATEVRKAESEEANLESTIFQQVSKRIRLLTPSLTKP